MVQYGRRKSNMGKKMINWNNKSDILLMSAICLYENCGWFFWLQNEWRSSMAEDKKKEIEVIEINEEFMK